MHEKPNPFEHVMDAAHWHLIDLVRPIPLLQIGPIQITKFMLLELAAAVLILLIYLPLARRLRSGQPPREGT